MALTLMGVLESRQGSRYTLTELSPSRLVAPFNSMLSLADYDVTEHFETRRWLISSWCACAASGQCRSSARAS
jgi:DNA-binding FadR family transcriptional regulator